MLGTGAARPGVRRRPRVRRRRSRPRSDPHRRRRRRAARPAGRVAPDRSRRGKGEDLPLRFFVPGDEHVSRGAARSVACAAMAGERSIAGRVAVVTGAASGMGRAIAELFAEEGAQVAACDRNEAGLHEVVARHRRGRWDRAGLPARRHRRRGGRRAPSPTPSSRRWVPSASSSTTRASACPRRSTATATTRRGTSRSRSTSRIRPHGARLPAASAGRRRRTHRQRRVDRGARRHAVSEPVHRVEARRGRAHEVARDRARRARDHRELRVPGPDQAPA